MADNAFSLLTPSEVPEPVIPEPTPVVDPGSQAGEQMGKDSFNAFVSAFQEEHGYHPFARHQMTAQGALDISSAFTQGLFESIEKQRQDALKRALSSFQTNNAFGLLSRTTPTAEAL